MCWALLYAPGLAGRQESLGIPGAIGPGDLAWRLALGLASWKRIEAAPLVPILGVLGAQGNLARACARASMAPSEEELAPAPGVLHAWAPTHWNPTDAEEHP